ncbi:MAG TPA: hypothetical protein VGC02_03880 [Methanobacterium sp.]
MELIWFYIAVVLAISDEIHSLILWRVFADFYILLAGILRETLKTNLALWIVHEGMEAVFHFIVLSLIFLSLEIGILAAMVHFLVDFFHELSGVEMRWIQHRALHFVVESFFFLMFFGLLGL